MALQMQWVDDASLDRVAEARWLAYAHGYKDLRSMRDRLAADPRSVAGDYLLAVRDGVTVGTATSLSFSMWMRGVAFPCQGVAWVGAAKTARRTGGQKTVGVATAVMNEMLRKAREREQAITALVPFRASYYEHFGYGLVERRHEWTIPISILPPATSENWTIAKTDDRAALVALKQKMVEAGQCEIERSAAGWDTVTAKSEVGFTFVVRLGNSPAPIAAATAIHEHRNGKDVLVIADWIASSFEDFTSLLRLFATLKDQYSSIVVQTPTHWPVNRVLKESQMPHRPVNHAYATASLIARLQVRILDHRKVLESLHLPSTRAGKASIAIQEPEGNAARFMLDISDGRITTKPGGAATADYECSAVNWAAIVCGDLSATRALQSGLATGSSDAAQALDALADGPPPFSQEAF